MILVIVSCPRSALAIFMAMAELPGDETKVEAAGGLKKKAARLNSTRDFSW